MTDSFPTFKADEAVSDTGLVGGDAYYTGNKRLEWIQPDPGNDGGYWEASDIPTTASAPTTADILKRLEAVEKELKIRKK